MKILIYDNFLCVELCETNKMRFYPNWLKSRICFVLPPKLSGHMSLTPFFVSHANSCEYNQLIINSYWPELTVSSANLIDSTNEIIQTENAKITYM